MKKGLISKIIGGMTILAAVGMAITDTPNWGWVAGIGFIIVLVAIEQEED